MSRKFELIWIQGYSDLRKTRRVKFRGKQCLRNSGSGSIWMSNCMKYVQWEPSCSMRAGERTATRTDRRDEDNSRFFTILRMHLKCNHNYTFHLIIASYLQTVNHFTQRKVCKLFVQYIVKPETLNFVSIWYNFVVF